MNSDPDRRDFLRAMGVGAVATVIPAVTPTLTRARGEGDRRGLDRFGGLESVRLEASGFFRVEKGDRWWLVTPAGAAFLSFGLNHTDVEYLLQDYNIDHWRREFGFQDRSEDAFREGFVRKVMKDLEVFGANTLGCHARKEVFGKLRVPYIQGLFFARTAYWIVRSADDYPDVFSEEFESRCRRVARRLCLPKRDDPFLIGYTFTNVPILTDLDARAHGMVAWGRPQPTMPTWPRALRNWSSRAPGKKNYVALMRERYREIGVFNRAYGTRFASFEELSDAENWSPLVETAGIDDAADNRSFLMRIYDRYHEVACRAVREFDPNHLIFGDPINANTPPPDEVVSLVARHTDLISYQYYGGYDEQRRLLDRWSRLTGKPLFNTDSCFSVPYEEMPNPVGAHCPDQTTRARRFLDFATRAFFRPDFVGWNWCGWVDAWASWRRVQQHCGLQDPFGRYHHPMPETMARFGSRLYDYALGKRAPVKWRSARRLDRFGGLESLRFEASGHFRVEKRDRWWFVTPDGAAFLSFGLNHPDPEYLLQDYNIGFWREKFGFRERSDAAFREGFIGKVLQDLEAFGMNTIGTHARKETYGELTVPHVQGLFFVRTPYWIRPTVRDFADVFSADFETHCEGIARKLVEPRRDDPYLIGYTLTDCPILTDRDAAACGKETWGGPHPEAPTWPRVLRNLGKDAPGKEAFVDLMRERHRTIGAFNRIYGTRFSSFEELLRAESWSPVRVSRDVDDARDCHAFLLKILGRYYTVATGAIRKFDASHLILGDVINAQTPPPDDVVSLVVRHADVVAYQFYGGYDEQSALLDRWSKLTGKPLFHADSCFCVPHEKMPAPVGAVCPDQETRARRFLDFATRTFSRPDFIGWNWCGWVDAWASWRRVRQHSGLQDPFGRYHHPMPETMSRFGSRLYDYALGKRAPARHK